MPGRVSNMSALVAPKIAGPPANIDRRGMCVLGALSYTLIIWILYPLGVLLRFVLLGDVMADFLAIQPVVVNTMLVAIAAAFFGMLIASVIVLTAAFRAGPKYANWHLCRPPAMLFRGRYWRLVCWLCWLY